MRHLQYAFMEKHEMVADNVFETTGVRVPAATIRANMSASAVSETEVFVVRIVHTDPKIAAAIANAITVVAPVEIEEIVEGSSTKIIDHAKVPQAPYSPNKQNNTIIGFVAGAVLAIAFIVLGVLMDVRVHGEEDLARLSAAAVLGVIPDFDVEEEKGYTYTAKKSADKSEVVEK